LFQITFTLSFLLLLSLKQQELQQPSCRPRQLQAKCSLQAWVFTQAWVFVSKDNDDRHYHRPDKDDAVFATFSPPKAKKKKHTQK
jgi:hypothetical protein